MPEVFFVTITKIEFIRYPELTKNDHEIHGHFLVEVRGSRSPVFFCPSGGGHFEV